ncbi:hypothetical protein CH373_01800 [Leptospira perolatii]|uniref:PIN domain-containing protein n=1 Tax=Leptospira perolatii TaxID=2023191 RepID=A0A2M9ZSY5_9LEPT|nr:hypothetical protein [Leptospira perolatii]PJZ71584.1 hypothetical protein CH360_01800 [Leptospira perolatii]PJZ75200.1 hypothetical protein CH373_01800 [Leptospira perolatii]
MRILLSSSSYQDLLFGVEANKSSVRNAVESLTKKNVLLYLPLPAIEQALAKEPNPIKREILWNQTKNLFTELLPVRKEEIALAIRLSASADLSFEEWIEIAQAANYDLEGILTSSASFKKQNLVKVLLTQEINFNGLA